MRGDGQLRLAGQEVDRRRFLQATAGLSVLAGGVSHAVGAPPEAIEPTGQAEHGEILWLFETENRVESTPTVVDGTVFAAEWDNGVFALDRETGEKIWELEIEHGTTASPMVVDGAVFITGLDETLYALDADSGEIIWKIGVEPTSSSPTVVDGVVYVQAGSKVYAIDAETAATRWEFEGEGDVPFGTDPTVVHGRVFVGTETRVYALDAQTGEQVWEFQTTDRIMQASATVADGTVYIGGGNEQTWLALDAATGEKRWEFETARVFSLTPTVHEGTVYVGDNDGGVFALDTETGTKQWTSWINGSTMSPTAVDGTVFVGSGVTAGEGVYAFDAETGDTRWSRGLEATDSSPIVVDGTLYIGAYDGVYAIAAGVDGSSEGSRVSLGTLGHHEEWKYADQSIDFVSTPPSLYLHASREVHIDEDPQFSVSGFEDRRIVEYDWDFDVGTGDVSFPLHDPAFSYDNPGKYEVSLTVTDALGNSATDTTTVVVRDFEKRDELDYAAQINGPQTVPVGEDPGLEAPDSALDIETYEWRFGDGKTASGESLTQPEHTYSTPGEYTILLTVVHSSGETATDTITIQVEKPDDATPANESGSAGDETAANESGSAGNETAADSDGSSDGSGPGFGIGSALTVLSGIGGAGYLLGRRLESSDEL